eukprot:COSAG04_NODE_1551_length_6378_cov_3.468864_3_plen_235_part_00
MLLRGWGRAGLQLGRAARPRARQRVVRFASSAAASSAASAGGLWLLGAGCGGAASADAGSEWTAHADPASGRTYYHNERTGATTWCLVDQLLQHRGAEAAMDQTLEERIAELEQRDAEKEARIARVEKALEQPDEDARAQRDMEQRLQIKSLEDEIAFVSRVTRRCWSACIEDADAPTQGNIAVDLSADELSCIGNCTSKVMAFQTRAAEVLMDQDAKKREANMKQMMHQQRAA